MKNPKIFIKLDGYTDSRGTPEYNQALGERRANVVKQYMLSKGVKAESVELNRSEEHTSELQSLMRISYAVFCLKKKNNITSTNTTKYDEQNKYNAPHINKQMNK